MSEKWMWLIGGAAFGWFVWPTIYGTFFVPKAS
jgi:hypothetical protein